MMRRPTLGEALAALVADGTLSSERRPALIDKLKKYGLK